MARWQWLRLTAHVAPLPFSLRNRSRGQERAFSTEVVAQATKKRSPAVRVGRTPLGRGVFARRRFRPQHVIGVVRGQVIDDPDYSSDYCIELNEGRGLEPAAPFRFLNHSCEPNCELFSWETDEAAPPDRLWLQALRSIEPGEELTIDYAWPAGAAIPCGCGAVACRGWIVSADQQDLLDCAKSAEPI